MYGRKIIDSVVVNKYGDRIDKIHWDSYGPGNPEYIEHAVCCGYMNTLVTSESHSVLVCAKCGLRIYIRSVEWDDFRDEIEYSVVDKIADDLPWPDSL